MIADDLEIAECLFMLVDSHIELEYDASQVEVNAHDSYMTLSPILDIDGVQWTDIALNVNGAGFYKLVSELKASAAKRGENWRSFTMSFRNGEQVQKRLSY